MLQRRHGRWGIDIITINKVCQTHRGLERAKVIRNIDPFLLTEMFVLTV